MLKDFEKEIAKLNIMGWSNIDLEPLSQTFVGVIIKGEEVFLTSLSEGCLVNVTPEYLVNNFCGRLLVNNINCDGYDEETFIQKRSYDFNRILNCPLEDFGNYNYLTLLRFSNLCKAVLTESFQNHKTYFIYMYYGENELSLFKEGDELPAFEDEFIEYDEEILNNLSIYNNKL